MHVEQVADYTVQGEQLGTYELKGQCSNCHTTVTGVFTKGYEANVPYGNLRLCPYCSCRTVRF